MDKQIEKIQQNKELHTNQLKVLQNLLDNCADFAKNSLTFLVINKKNLLKLFK